eukprot:jgi/Mesvir1/15070/Mv14717-RA.1
MHQSPSSSPLTPKRPATPGDGGENRTLPARANVIGSPSRRISAVNPLHSAGGARTPMDSFLSLLASGGCTVADSCSFSEDPRSLGRHLCSKLSPSRGLADSFLRCFEAHFSLEKEIHSLLTPIRGPNVPSDSVVRVMLGVPCIQSQVINILLEKLPELLADEDSRNLQATSLPQLIISQLRWLEFVEEPAALTSKLLDMLPLCPPDLRNDLLSLLPDITPVDQHAAVVESLLALLQQDPVASTAPVLDALAQLCPERELLANAVAAGMGCLASAGAGDLPVVIRFLLQNAAEDNVEQIVQALRKSLAFLSTNAGMEINPLPSSRSTLSGSTTPSGSTAPRPTQKDKGKAVATGIQASAEPNWVKSTILDALCSGLARHRLAGTQFLSDVEALTCPADIQVVDLWVLLLLQARQGGGTYGGGPMLASAAWGGGPGGVRKVGAAMVSLNKVAEAVLKRKIVAGHFGSYADVASLLYRAVGTQGGALREYFGELVRVAGELLAASQGGGGVAAAGNHGGDAMRAFGGGLYVALFRGFPDDFHRQEVLAALLTHTGAHGPEATASLRTLAHLARSCAPLLRPFAVFIHNILDYLSSFSDDQLRLVFQIFGALATSQAEDAPNPATTAPTSMLTPAPSPRNAAAGKDAHPSPHEDNAGGKGSGDANAGSGGNSSSSGGRESLLPQLPPELMIVIRKQLSSGLPQFKRIGVLGAVTLLAQLGSAPTQEEKAATAAAGAGASAARARIRARLDAAMALLRQTEEACAHCPPGRAFLYDELAAMLQSGDGAGGGKPIGQQQQQDGAGNGSSSMATADADPGSGRVARKGAGAGLGGSAVADASSNGGAFGGVPPLHPRLVAHLTLMASNEVEGSFIASIEEAEGEAEGGERGSVVHNGAEAAAGAPDMGAGTDSLPGTVTLRSNGGVELRSRDWYNLDGEEAPVKLALFDMLASGTKDRRDSALWMAPALRLLAEASMREHAGEAEPLEGMDALLGCPLQLVDKAAVTEGRWDGLGAGQQRVVVQALFFAVNWMRELLNAFSSQLVTDASALENHGTSSGSGNGPAAATGAASGAADGSGGLTGADGGVTEASSGSVIWSGTAAEYAIKLVKRLKAIRELEALLDRLVGMGQGQGPCSTGIRGEGGGLRAGGWELPCLSEMLVERSGGGGGAAASGGVTGRKPAGNGGKGKGKRPAGKAGGGAGKGRPAKVARKGSGEEGAAAQAGDEDGHGDDVGEDVAGGDADGADEDGQGAAKRSEEGGDVADGGEREGQAAEEGGKENRGSDKVPAGSRGKGDAGAASGSQPSFVCAHRGLFRVLLPRSLVLLQLAPRMAWVAEATGIRPDHQLLLLGYLAEDLLAKLDWVVGQEGAGASGKGGGGAGLPGAKAKTAPWLAKAKGAGGSSSASSAAISLRGVSPLQFLDGLRGVFPSLRLLMDTALASLSRAREHEDQYGGGMGDDANSAGGVGGSGTAGRQGHESTQGFEAMGEAGEGEPAGVGSTGAGGIPGESFVGVFLCLQSCVQRLLQSARLRSPEGRPVLLSLLSALSAESSHGDNCDAAALRTGKGPIPGLPLAGAARQRTATAAANSNAPIPSAAFSAAFDHLESLAGSGALLERRAACSLVCTLDTLAAAASALLGSRRGGGSPSSRGADASGGADDPDENDEGSGADAVEALRHRLSVAAGSVLAQEWPGSGDGCLNAWAGSAGTSQLASLLRLHVRYAESPLALLEDLVEDALPRIPSKGGKSAHEGVGGHPSLCHATLGTWYNVLHEEAVAQLGLLAQEAKGIAAREKGSRQKLRKGKGGKGKGKGKGKNRRGKGEDEEDEEGEMEGMEEDEVEDGDEERAAEIEDLLQRCGVCVDVHANLVLLTKRHEKRGPILAAAVKFGGKFVDGFLKGIMPMLQGPRFLSVHEASVLQLLERLQKGTRCVQTLCSEGKTRQLVSVAAKVPAVKRVMERFLFTVKALMHGSELAGAFQIANLKHKDLRGQVVASQVAPSDSEEEGEEEEEDGEEGEEGDEGEEEEEEEAEDAQDDD